MRVTASPITILQSKWIDHFEKWELIEIGIAGADAPDPVLALVFAAARTSKIKLGTSVSVLPGRSPALVAKEWATLDVLSGGRALPAFGLGIVKAAR